MAIGRTVDPHGPTVDVRLNAADILARAGPWMARSASWRGLMTVALAAFAILVRLPAAIAAQATTPI